MAVIIRKRNAIIINVERRIPRRDMELIESLVESNLPESNKILTISKLTSLSLKLSKELYRYFKKDILEELR